MKMDCIPVGMELFPAIDEEQLQFIKRIIDDCDYYILIIGGRYGSTTPEGISYTEKEYDYAIERGIKVLAFLHEKPDEIPVGKTDKDVELQERLNKFREKASTGRLVEFWTKAEELPGKVALSLIQTIRLYPAIGWVRANQIANVDVLGELNELRKRNVELEKLTGELPKELLNLDDIIDLAYRVDLFRWEVIKVSFGELFKRITTGLSSPILECDVRENLTELLRFYMRCNAIESIWLDREDFLTIKFQFISLELITVNAENYWSLTPKGNSKLLELYALKKAVKSNLESSY
jgi:hypothetical protein